MSRGNHTAMRGGNYTTNINKIERQNKEDHEITVTYSFYLIRNIQIVPISMGKVDTKVMSLALCTDPSINETGKTKNRM